MKKLISILIGCSLLFSCTLAAAAQGLITETIISVQEPFKPSTLNALERLLSKLTNEHYRTQVAGILYRYRRESGHNYLLKTLRTTGNVEAASILAMNHDLLALPYITKVLLRHPDEDANYLLIPALLDWQIPQVSDALLKAFQAAPQNSRLALAVARHGIKQAEPLLWKQYKAHPLGSQREDLYAAASLVKLNALRTQPLLNTLFDKLNLQKQLPIERLELSLLIDAFMQLREVRAAPALENMIEGYLQHPPTINNSDVASVQAAFEAKAFVARAASALAAMQDKSALPFLTDLLARFTADKSKAQFNWADKEMAEQVAQALLQFDSSNSQPVLEKTMGEQWRQKQLLMKKLRPVPTRLLKFDEPLFNILRPYL